jgi:hypothetical protein
MTYLIASVSRSFLRHYEFILVLSSAQISIRDSSHNRGEGMTHYNTVLTICRKFYVKLTPVSLNSMRGLEIRNLNT